MEELRTTDSVVEYLSNAVKNKLPVSAYEFLEAAQILNLLIGDEQEKLFLLQQKVAQKKTDLVLEQPDNQHKGRSVAFAKTIIEASN